MEQTWQVDFPHCASIEKYRFTSAFTSIHPSRFVFIVYYHHMGAILPGLPEVSFIRQARDAGIDSFIYKNVGTKELLGVLRSTLDGYTTFPIRRGDDVFGAVELSGEEVQILRLACEAKSRKEIAEELLISEGTAKRRISELLAKTGYDSLLKLAVHAVSSGHIVPSMETLPD